MKQLEKAWDMTETAAYLGVSKTWLYGKLQSGEVPGHKLGGLWRIYPSELQRYLEQCQSNRRRIV